MKEYGLYDFDSSELFECIGDVKIDLKNNNYEYKNKFYKIERIKNKYPRLRDLLENQTAHKLNFNECKALLEIVNLTYDLWQMEKYEIFFLGGRECIGYLNKMEIL